MNDPAISSPMSRAGSNNYTSPEAPSGDQLIELFRSQIRELYGFTIDPPLDHQRFTAARAALDQAPRRIAEYIARENEFRFLPPADNGKLYSPGLLARQDGPVEIARTEAADDFSFKPFRSMVSIRSDGTIVLGNAGCPGVLGGKIDPQLCRALLEALQALGGVLRCYLDQKRSAALHAESVACLQPGLPSDSLLRELIDSAIPETIARGLIQSGHYAPVSAEEAKALVGVAVRGWVVRFLDLGGVAHLRLNDASSSPFVRLKPVPALTSRNGDKPPKYLSASGAGCRPYFSPLLQPSVRDPQNTCDVDITEGEKKADAACVHGFPTIGLSGVDCWRDRRNGESAFLPELEALKWEGRTVRLVFDSDLSHKAGVRSALRELAFELTRRGAKVLITTIPCELPDGPGNPTPDKWKTGLDDFMRHHGPDAYRILRQQARPCVKKADDGLEWAWSPEPHHKETRTKALIARAVFKDAFAVDHLRGALHWCGTHWRELPGKPDAELSTPFLHWCDAMGWEHTGIGSSVTNQLLAELRAREPWDPPHLLAFTNGTLDTRNNRFTTVHRREDRLTFCHPFAYNPQAACNRWRQFLVEALDGDQQLIAILRAAIRWTLEPKDNTQPFPIEKCFDVGGPRGSGKGTLAEVLQALVGGTDGGAGILRSSMLGHEQAMYNLLGKRLAYDPDGSGHIGDVGLLNAVISNEAVPIKKLYVNATNARLGVVVWRFFNDEIRVSGGGVEGLGRRIVPISFSHQPARPDIHLKQTLLKELPGIFAWAWAMDLSEAFTAIAAASSHQLVLQDAIEAELDRNPIYAFLVESYPDGAPELPVRDLYGRWRQWAENSGHHAGSIKVFGAALKKINRSGPRRVGREKVHCQSIPAMKDFDWGAFLRIGGVDPMPLAGGPDVGSNPRADPAGGGLDATAIGSTSSPLQVHAQIAEIPTSSTALALGGLDGLDSSSIKEEERKEGLQGAVERLPPADKGGSREGPSNRVHQVHLPAVARSAVPSADTAPGPRPSPSDAILTCRAQVEQALAELKAGPYAPGIVFRIAQRLPGISRSRIATVLQELIREEREAEQLDLLS